MAGHVRPCSPEISFEDTVQLVENLSICTLRINAHVLFERGSALGKSKKSFFFALKNI
jgi:hypothetical protein